MIHLGGITAAHVAPQHSAEAAALQAEAVFNTLEARIAEQGGSLTDLCKITMQITDRQ